MSGERPPLTPRRMLEIAAMDLVMLVEFAHMELHGHGYETRQQAEGGWRVFDMKSQRYLSREEQEQLPEEARELIQRIRRLDLPDLE